MLSTRAPTISDAADVQLKLCGPCDALAAAHRNTIAQAVGALVRSTAATSSSATTPKLHKHTYLYSYFTDGDWQELDDPHTSIEHCQNVVANRSMRIGFLRPQPLNYVTMMRTICTAKRKFFSPDIQYAHKNELKQRWAATTASRRGTTPLLHSYPCDVQDFIHLHPDVYDAADPPVSPRVHVSDVLEGASLAPCPNTHASIRVHGKQSSREQFPGSNPQAGLLDTLVHMVMNGASSGSSGSYATPHLQQQST